MNYDKTEEKTSEEMVNMHESEKNKLDDRLPH